MEPGSGPTKLYARYTNLFSPWSFNTNCEFHIVTNNIKPKMEGPTGFVVIHLLIVACAAVLENPSASILNDDTTIFTNEQIGILKAKIVQFQNLVSARFIVQNIYYIWCFYIYSTRRRILLQNQHSWRIGKVIFISRSLI